MKKLRLLACTAASLLIAASVFEVTVDESGRIATNNRGGRHRKYKLTNIRYYLPLYGYYLRPNVYVGQLEVKRARAAQVRRSHRAV